MSSHTTPQFERPESCPSLLDLASFVDGMATADLKTSIEHHIAQCAICAEFVRDADEAKLTMVDGFTFVPAHVLQAAVGLVPDQKSRGVLWLIASRRVATVAASLAICVLGYRAGASISSINAPTSQADDLTAAISFGVLDTSMSDSELLTVLNTETEQ